jgi:purine-nucleoside phosphorylase
MKEREGATMPDETMGRLGEAIGAIRGRSTLEPRVGIILGTGLGGLALELDVDVALPYGGIPHFPTSTVESHEGRLLLGRLEGTPVVAMQGRFHAYEGYTLKEVTFPVRVMKLLGVEVLVVSGACGGMNPLWAPGELVLLDDHINLLGDSPLVGPNLDELGPRFPDMSEPYDRELQELALDTAMASGIRLHRGVYVAVKGPHLETRAEYRMLRTLGADVVGMSTVPEVIVARHMGMRVLGVTIITDACLPDALEPADIGRIIETAKAAEPHLATVIRGIVGQL